MGMFSRNRTGLGSYSGSEIVANENYYGELGALQIALEGVQNDQDIFMACLEGDFEETAGLMSGVITESQIIEEAGGAISGMIEKIKAMVKKIWEKIKGLFETFIKKINTVIIRDNKKFVEKYKREVLGKDLSKMTYKASKPKEGWAGALEKLKKKGENALDAANTQIDTDITSCISNFEEVNEKINDGRALDELCAATVKGSDSDSFEKDYHEELFDDNEEHDGLSGSDISEIMSILVEKKLVSNLETTKKKVDKVFSDYLRKIDKVGDRMAKNIPGDEVKEKDGSDRGKSYLDVGRADNSKNLNFRNNKESKDKAMKRISAIQRLVSVSQGFYSRVSSCQIKEMKFLISQARSVFAKAVTYNPKKSANENAVFMEAAGDAAVYDVMSSFESYEM